MQNPDHFVQGWQVIVDKCIKMRLACRWLLSAAMVIAMLGVGWTAVAIQAQDGGNGSGRTLTADFVLQVNAADPKLRSLCIGKSFQLHSRAANILMGYVPRFHRRAFPVNGNRGDCRRKTIRFFSRLTGGQSSSRTRSQAEAAARPGRRSSPSRPFVSSDENDEPPFA